MNSRRALGLLLSGLTLLTACQTGTEVTPRRVSPAPSLAPSPASSTAAGSPSPAASAQASPSIAPAPSAPAPEINKLQKPEGAVSTLTGIARLDAHYIISQNGGAIISGGAGNFVVAGIISGGAGNIISGNAGAIISGNSGAIISGNSGAIISAGAGNIIAGGAGNLVNGGGGNIISGGAGNIISGGAGNIISGNAGAYRLAQAATAPEPGTVLPIVGVRMSVVSLRTGQLVPVGVDKDKKPVYTVYSNAEGRYELYLPESEQGNVRVVANVLETTSNDRFHYDLVSEARTATSQDLDEDTAIATYMLREVFVSRLIYLMTTAEPDKYIASLTTQSEGGAGDMLKDTVKAIFEELRAASEKAGIHVNGQTPAGQARARRVAQAVTDRVLAVLPLDSITINPPGQPRSNQYWDGPTEPAIPAVVDILRLARKEAVHFLPPERVGYFEQQSWFMDAKRTFDPSVPPRIPADFRIERPSDIGSFLVTAYLSRQDGSVSDQVAAILRAIGANRLVPPMVSAENRNQGERVIAAAYALIMRIMLALITDEEKSKTDGLILLDKIGKETAP